MELDQPARVTPGRCGRHRWIFTGVSALLACAVLLFAVHFHEPWRDETQALLLAAQSSSLGELLRSVRYEGHPPLIHLFFAFSTRVFPRPWDLFVVGALGYWVLLQGIFHFLTAFSRDTERRSGWVAIAFGLTYTVFYELGVIARGYGLGLGLALWGGAWILTGPDTRARRISSAILLGLAMLSSFPAACVAGAAVFVRAIEDGRRRSWKPVVEYGLALLPWVLLSGFYLIPPPNWAPAWDAVIQSSRDAGRVFSLAWRLLLDFSPENWWAFAPYPGVQRRVIAVGFIGILGMGLWRRPTDPARALGRRWLLISSSILFALFALKKAGAYRHHVFLSWPILLFFASSLLGSGSRLENGSKRGLIQVAMGLLALTLGNEFYENALALRRDGTWAFSNTAAIAKALPLRSLIVSDPDFISTSIAYWRPDVELMSPSDGGRRYRAVRWDLSRFHQAEMSRIFQLACQIQWTEDRPVFFAGWGAIPLSSGCLKSPGPEIERALEVQVESERIAVVRKVDCSSCGPGR